MPDGTSRSLATEMAICADGRALDAGESMAAGELDVAAELDVAEEVGVGVGVGDGPDKVGVGVGFVVGVGEALCDGGGAIELGCDDGAELAVDGLGAGV